MRRVFIATAVDLLWMNIWWFFHPWPANFHASKSDYFRVEIDTSILYFIFFFIHFCLVCLGKRVKIRVLKLLLMSIFPALSAWQLYGVVINGIGFADDTYTDAWSPLSQRLIEGFANWGLDPLCMIYITPFPDWIIAKTRKAWRNWRGDNPQLHHS